MGREENLAVFKDTERLCRNNPVIMDSVKKSVEAQELISETEQLKIRKKLGYDQHHPNAEEVIVSKKRSFEAASAYKDKKVCVHNFASATNPGGGVVNGATAQEECLCRVSTLYFCLDTKKMWDGFYGPHRRQGDALHNDDCIYTPDVLVLKTDTAMPSLLADRDRYSVNVITCAAPNLRQKPGDNHKPLKITDKALMELHEKRLSRILDIAYEKGNEVVILGAFGCGAFLNNPEVVARAAKNVVAKYKTLFDVIEFAVYCSPKDETNYRVFERVLRGV